MNRLAAGEGPLASLRTLASTLLDLVGTRAELALAELREEAERRERALAIACIAALFLTLGLLLAAFLVIVVFWETHRIAATAVMTAIYLGIAAGAYAKLRAARRTAAPPFEATLRELALDRKVLAGGEADE